MRILHIALAVKYIEGWSYQENTLPEKQAELGHEVHVITAQDYELPSVGMYRREPNDYISPHGLHVYILKQTAKNQFFFWFINRVYGLYDHIDKIHPDVIFVHGVNTSDTRTIIKYIKKHPQTKLYADHHYNDYNKTFKWYDLSHNLKTFLTRHYAQKLAKYGEKIWGTLPLRVNYLRDVCKIPEKKLGLLIMGADEKLIQSIDVDLARKTIREKYNIPEDAFLIVTGGKLDKRKNQHLLAEAVNAIKKENVWLLIFGTPTPDMAPIYEKIKTYQRVVQAGWLDSKDIYNYLLASDVVVYPGTHSVIWEQAVACGLPLVVQRWNGLTHVDINGNVRFLDNISIDVLKDVIEELSVPNNYFKIKKKAEAAAPFFYLSEIANKAVGITK